MYKTRYIPGSIASTPSIPSCLLPLLYVIILFIICGFQILPFFSIRKNTYSEYICSVVLRNIVSLRVLTDWFKTLVNIVIIFKYNQYIQTKPFSMLKTTWKSVLSRSIKLVIFNKYLQRISKGFTLTLPKEDSIFLLTEQKSIWPSKLGSCERCVLFIYQNPTLYSKSPADADSLYNVTSEVCGPDTIKGQMHPNWGLEIFQKSFVDSV